MLERSMLINELGHFLISVLNCIHPYVNFELLSLEMVFPNGVVINTFILTLMKYIYRNDDQT